MWSTYTTHTFITNPCRPLHVKTAHAHRQAHTFTTTVVTLSKDRSLWMHATPSNLKQHSPVAYMKLSMPEILADRNFMQEMKV